MPNFFNLPPFADNGDVHVVVETPRGSRAKFAYDPKLESFALRKSLLTGLSFIPMTGASCHQRRRTRATRLTLW